MKHLNSIIIIVLIIVLLSIAVMQISFGNSTKINTNGKLENAILVYIDSSLAIVNEQEKQIDPENNLIVPFVEENRSLVPVRFIAESLGAKVSWDQANQSVCITMGNKEIKMITGCKEMFINSKKIALDVPAIIKNQRTFVPLRAISEAFGKQVFYDRGLIIISDMKNIFDTEQDRRTLNQLIEKVNKLPVIGTKEKFIKILGKLRNSNINYLALKNMNRTMKFSQESTADSSEQSIEYSTTNIQVEGVDEADIVKTDGEYIYQVNNEKVVIAKAYPADEMKVIKTIKFDETSFFPKELYIDNKNLIVLGSVCTHYDYPIYRENSMQSSTHFPANRVKAYIYDIKNKNNIEQLREVEIEGYYITSRKIGSSLYMIANSNIGFDTIKNENIPLGPMYKDSHMSEEFKHIAYEDIKYMPPIMYPQYLVIASLDLNSNEEVQVETYLGSSNDVYVSQDNIYVAIQLSQYVLKELEEDVKFDIENYEPKTMIYKFSMDKGKTTYLTKGEVPGTILNQFSMDEYKKSFRIATTRQTRINNQYTSTNNVYVLNENLNITGKIEKIAPEERIYSVRFMGDRGYMVTFKNVDPLFVLDLKDPNRPSILGKLKIPGYSDYLHPYDENHLIGFGKDTIELPIKDWKGNDQGMRPYYMGIKVALFDVSDVNNPIEKHKVIIGDRGTESELLRDHKALLFNKKRNILGFPITVREVKGELIDSESGIPRYGSVTFQGAYVYELTPEKGFNLKGKISHMSSDDHLKSGYYDVSYEKTIRRLLYIGNYLYGVSNEMISAHDIDTLKKENSITIE